MIAAGGHFAAMEEPEALPANSRLLSSLALSLCLGGGDGVLELAAHLVAGLRAPLGHQAVQVATGRRPWMMSDTPESRASWASGPEAAAVAEYRPSVGSTSITAIMACSAAYETWATPATDWR